MLGMEAIGGETNPTFYDKISSDEVVIAIGLTILFVFSFFKIRAFYNSKGKNFSKNFRLDHTG